MYYVLRRQGRFTYYVLRVACCVGVAVLVFLPAFGAGRFVQADDLPPAASVEGVVGHPQGRNLSCESRSATDVAGFWGVGFEEDVFFRRLPKSDNPQRGFVGDVDGPAGSMPPVGYGVYAGPIAATLRSFGLEAEARRGWSLEGLKGELAAGRPVIVWATYDMRLGDVERWVSWDGESSAVVQWQHTFIAVAYDEGGLTLVDAYDGVAKYFSFGAFTPAWDQLGRLAVTVEGRGRWGREPYGCFR